MTGDSVRGFVKRAFLFIARRHYRESVDTCEGTYEIHTLVPGKGFTEIDAVS